MRFPLLLLFLFAVPSISSAQPRWFDRLDVEKGLSQNSVLCVAEDSRGFMWLGTRNGLNKYDSRKITVYKNRPGDSSSLSNNYILSLLCDSKQTLWVGTRDGLHRYKAAADKFERVPVTGANGQAGSIAITCIYEDRQKRLWIGTPKSLFLLSGREKPVFHSFAGHKDFPSRGVLCMYEDRSGILWAGTYDGLVKITSTAAGFEASVRRRDPANNNSLSDNQVTSITQDKQGYLWMGTLNGGLNRYDAQQDSFVHYVEADRVPGGLVNNHIRKLLYDGQEHIWIGTQEGLSTLDLRSGSFTSFVNDPWDKNSLSQNSVHSLFRDNTGNIWVGTFFGGVNCYPAFSTGFTVYNNSSRQCRLSNNVVSAIVEDDQHNLWIGTEGGGLNYMDRQTGQVIYYQHKAADATSIGSNLVKTIYKDRLGNIWAGTHGGGLNLFDPATNSFKRYLYKDNDPETLGAEIPCLLEDSKGIFWIGTETAGIKLFRKQGTSLSPFPEGNVIKAAIGNKAILSFLETADHQVWVGTAAGLYLIAANQVKLIEEKTGSYPCYVNSLMEDARGNIWAGTYYNGLLVYNNAGVKIAAYTQQNGLPDNNVLSILQDNNRKDIWAGTANGMARLDPDSGSITVYTEADGLAGNVFNNNACYKSKSGELFLGGYKGFAVFYPDRVKENTVVPPVFITDLKLFGRPVAINGPDHILTRDISFTPEIRLNYDQNVLTLDFAILNYIKPQKNSYAYKLEGIDKDWTYTPLASASWSNLAPGTYTFAVKGANNDGIWSLPATLKIIVSPPFWKTWWAYIIYGLLFITLVFFIVRFFFLRALLRRNQELTRLKLNFFTNISHEIRTHLSLITGPAEKLIHSDRHDHYEKQLLRTIKTNSESLLQLVNELMDFRKAETGHLPLQVYRWDIVSLAGSVFDAFHDQSVSRNIRAGFISSSPAIEAWFDKEQLEKVFFNLLSNAFKFTPDGGYISMGIEENDSTVEIRVTDNGRGIAKENIERLFENYFQGDSFGKQNTGYGIGLALSKSIVEIHKGTLVVSSEKSTDGQYITCFTIALPKGNSHFSTAQIVNHSSTIVTAQDMAIAPTGQAGPASLLSPTEAIKNTVLLVEDNAGIRTFIKNALQQQYHILESNNGLEGLSQAMESVPDLVISDVMMPEMDGLTFCSRMKNDVRTSHIPVILLTAKTEVQHQVSGLQTGADVYLTKPFSIQVLELQIRNLLASRERLWQQFRQQLNMDPAEQAAESGGTVSIENLSSTPVALHPLDEAFLKNITEMVEENMGDPAFGIAYLSKKAAMSQPVLFKKIKAITGMSANDFVKSLRLKKATQLLQENRYTVYEIAFMVGYEDSKYFSKEFKKQFGKTPSEYARS